jgi:hypothetical protein
MLTHDRLKALLSYNPETGLFTRLQRRTNALPIAGSVRTDGYLSIFVDGCAYPAHRLAWFFVHGEWPERRLDHRNGNKCDNRIANLREATHSENLQNRGTAYANSTSGILGVYPRERGRWQARIQVNGRAKSLGLYDTKADAAAAYASAKAKFHPFAEMPLHVAEWLGRSSS